VPISAGPKLRAGLTDDPLIWSAATWMATSASGITVSACRPYVSLLVTWRITATNRAVITTSTTMPAQLSPDLVVVRATASLSNATSTTSEAPIAPANCATQ
jgi:hypothetical protein